VATRQLPCAWWSGLNLYSGAYDRLGPPQRLGSAGRRAIDTLVGQAGNRYIVYVPELSTDSDGSVSIGSSSISDQHLVEAAQYARGRGAVAVLKPHVSDPTNQADLPRFASTYAAALKHYGAIATQMQARVFVIATELGQLYRDPSAMNALIDAASSSYRVAGGQLAVAINWDQLHEALSFAWLHRIALVGVDGYWPLAPPGESPGGAAIESQWRQAAYQEDGYYESPGDAIASLGAAGHEVVFTEIGYPRCQGGSAQPSAQPDPDDPTMCGQASDSPREQRLATQAAYCYWTQWSRDHGSPGWFHGLWWWDWDLSAARNVWDVSAGDGAAVGVIQAWNAGRGPDCPERGS
jgi:hypothetical protein